MVNWPMENRVISLRRIFFVVFICILSRGVDRVTWRWTFALINSSQSKKFSESWSMKNFFGHFRKTDHEPPKCFDLGQYVDMNNKTFERNTVYQDWINPNIIYFPGSFTVKIGKKLKNLYVFYSILNVSGSYRSLRRRGLRLRDF